MSRSLSRAAVTAVVESLEQRRLLTTYNIVDFGAVSGGGDDTHAIRAAIRAAGSGDTILFPAGTWDISGTVFVPGGRILKGEAGNFIRAGVSNRQYAFGISGDASNVTIDGLRIHGGGIRLTDGSRYTNIRIVNNTISGTAGTPGVYATIHNTGLIVEHNTFRDFAHWGAILYHVDQGSYSHNTVTNVTQGLHMLNPYNDVRVSFNYGTGLKRMAIEIQQLTWPQNPPTRNLTVEGNVFHNWNQPYWESFGLSIVPQSGYNVRVINNYIASTFSGGWGQPDSSGVYRFGYGIEAGFVQGEVSNNIIAGNYWCNHVVASRPNTPLNYNTFYGRPVWNQYWAGEPGHGPTFGSWIPVGNVIIADMGQLPAPPTGAGAGGNGGGGGTGGGGGGSGGGGTNGGGQEPTPWVPTFLNGFAFSSNSIGLWWTDTSADERGFAIERSQNNRTWQEIDRASSGSFDYTDSSVQPGRYYWYRVRYWMGAETPSSGTWSDYSNTVLLLTPGGPGRPASWGAGSTPAPTSPFADGSDGFIRDLLGAGGAPILA